MMWAMDWLETEELRVAVAYLETADPEGEEEHETYAGVGVVESPLNYGWNHGIGETIDALIRAGLRSTPSRNTTSVSGRAAHDDPGRRRAVASARPTGTAAVDVVGSGDEG